MLLDQLVDLVRLAYAKIFRRPVALCDVGDVDGLVSAAIFLRARHRGVVIFGAPSDVARSRIFRMVRWDFVADLPCPGRVRVRADHHVTNSPCAELEFYDPDAPCAAILAAKAFNLLDDPEVSKLVRIAIETDTASISSREAYMLDLIVRHVPRRLKQRLARDLATRGLSAVLSDERYLRWLRVGEERMRIVKEISSRIPVGDAIVVYSPRRLGISYRALTIELQRRGTKFVNILVRLGLNKFRLYCGADRESKYSCIDVVSRFGGGGHRYAAGAQYRGSIKAKRELIRLVRAIEELGIRDLSTYVIERDLSVRRVDL